MDDQRPQQAWEVTKDWIPKARDPSAQAVFDNFTARVDVVRARGSVSKQYYFESTDPSPQRTDGPGLQAAYDLSVAFHHALRQACAVIPKKEISADSDPVYLPARAIVSSQGNNDYLPICIEANLESGRPLPGFLKVHPETGLLSIDPDNELSTDIKILLHFKQFEGEETKRTLETTISMDDEAPLVECVNLVLRTWLAPSDLEGRVKSIIQEHLDQIYDFKTQAMRRCSLGKFFKVMNRCLAMLRAAVVANLAPPPGYVARSVGTGALSRQPMTPP